MSDSTLLTLMRDLTERVTGLASDVAVLRDRNRDNVRQDKDVEKVAQDLKELRDRLTIVEHALIEKSAQVKALIAVATAGGAGVGFGAPKLIALLQSVFGG
jgi:hypothetical protein